MKYIAFDQGAGEDMVIFSGRHTHADMAQRLHLKPDQILGAGAIHSSDTMLDNANADFHCYGRAHSLNRWSRQREDNDLLRRMLGE